jgi:hypothetical protein
MWTRAEREATAVVSSGPRADARAGCGAARAAASAPEPSAKAAAVSPSPSPSPSAGGRRGDRGRKVRVSSERQRLWQKPIPRLSTLLLSKKLIQAPFRKRLELEIAAVNNGDQEIRDLSLMVSFFEQDPPPSNKKYPVSHRALYFQGPLAPGQAIKWSAEARGETFEVEHQVSGDIGPWRRRSPTNLLASLLDANHRPRVCTAR